MSVWVFAIAAFLSLPKQLATVYIGVIIATSGSGSVSVHHINLFRRLLTSCPPDEKVSQRVASYTVIVVTTVVTIAAAWYIYRELNRVKPAVIYARRKARFVLARSRNVHVDLSCVLPRQAKMELGTSYYSNNQSTMSAFNPDPSESDIPLQPYDSERDPVYAGPRSQQWDETGQAVGYVPDPRLHAPRPRQPSFSPTALYASPAAAAAATASEEPEPEDEWSNAHTPSSARHPQTLVPASGLYAPGPRVSSPPSSSYDHSLSSTSTPSFPPPPQSPQRTGGSRRARSPRMSADVQYVSFKPDRFAPPPPDDDDDDDKSAPRLQQRQERAFSPPPSYKS